MITPELVDTLMQHALRLAESGGKAGEVPVGAVFYHHDKVISAHHNLVESRHDASAHAEMLVISEASRMIGDWRLNQGILCVTLEPCTMCSGAIRLSRVGTVIFGASDPRLGAVGSLFDICEDSRLGECPRVIRNVREEQCRSLLQDFFHKIREKR